MSFTWLPPYNKIVPFWLTLPYINCDTVVTSLTIKMWISWPAAQLLVSEDEFRSMELIQKFLTDPVWSHAIQMLRASVPCPFSGTLLPSINVSYNASFITWRRSKLLLQQELCTLLDRVYFTSSIRVPLCLDPIVSPRTEVPNLLNRRLEFLFWQSQVGGCLTCLE